MLGRRGMVGLAITRRSATAVEIAVARGGPRPVRAAEFVFPEDVGLEDTDRLGKALKEFLRKERFTASRCVIGMEAGWLTARHKSLPPGPSESVPEILSIVIEREFATDRKDLLFDYAAQSDTAGQPSVLLVAAPRRTVNQLAAIAQGAGLTVAGVTSSLLSLTGVADGTAVPEQLVLHLFGGGAELAVRSQGALRIVRRLPVAVPQPPPAGPVPADGWMDTLVHELHRVVYMLHGDASADLTGGLLIWDEIGLDPETRAALADRLALPIRTGDAPDGLRQAGADAAPGGQYAAAAAIAQAGLHGPPLAVDFLHSRLTPRRRLTVGRKVAWGVGIAAAVVLAVAVLVFDWIQSEYEVASLEATKADQADSIAKAKAVVNEVTFARQWCDARPRFLNCLRQLTLSFPVEGTIWTTSLALHEDMRGVVSGKAIRESVVLEVLDRIKANPGFAEVKPLYLREAGRGQREVAFAMSFRFVGSE